MPQEISLPSVLVLDFDGTVYVGDAPVWAYAEAVIANNDISDDRAETLRVALSEYLSGDGPRYVDGYEAVAELSSGLASSEQLQAAYLASRGQLIDGSLEVIAPTGLADFLRSLDGLAERVLVTNAPVAGVEETLTRLGLDDVIDRVEAEAAKPSGFDALLPALLGEREPRFLLSVGDIWANDIRPPLEFGCATAFIDRFGHASGPANLHGTNFTELYAGIADWAADPSGFVSRHPLTTAVGPAPNLPVPAARTTT